MRVRDKVFVVTGAGSGIGRELTHCLLSRGAHVAGVDLDPISLEALPPCRVVYIRYHGPMPAIAPVMEQGMGRRRRGMRTGGPMARVTVPPDIVDQLEATLKPLGPKVIDVVTPEQVTRAMAEIAKGLLSSER